MIAQVTPTAEVGPLGRYRKAAGLRPGQLCSHMVGARARGGITAAATRLRERLAAAPARPCEWAFSTLSLDGGAPAGVCRARERTPVSWGAMTSTTAGADAGFPGPDQAHRLLRHLGAGRAAGGHLRRVRRAVPCPARRLAAVRGGHARRGYRRRGETAGRRQLPALAAAGLHPDRGRPRRAGRLLDRPVCRHRDVQAERAVPQAALPGRGPRLLRAARTVRDRDRPVRADRADPGADHRGRRQDELRRCSRSTTSSAPSCGASA